MADRADKNIYAFGGDTAEGGGKGKELLGGKGYGLAEMSLLGIPVPPGFTITTAVCTYYQAHEGKYPETLSQEVEEHLKRVEERLGQRFGDPENPLLVSVRSGAPMSMPGMMDTILNLGLNDEIVKAWIGKGADPRFVMDAYRRLLSMYGDVVLNVPRHDFEQVLTAAREKEGVATDAELSKEALGAIACKYEEIIAGHGTPFPQDPKAQLWGAVGAVFESWNNRRAREYRRLNHIPDHLGHGGQRPGHGLRQHRRRLRDRRRLHPRPVDRRARLYGEYLINAQGEDVVAGIRTPKPILSADGKSGLGADFPAANEGLEAVCRRLEKHFHDMQDVEFTIQDGKLYMLQSRTGKRTGPRGRAHRGRDGGGGADHEGGGPAPRRARPLEQLLRRSSTSSRSRRRSPTTAPRPRPRRPARARRRGKIVFTADEAEATAGQGEAGASSSAPRPRPRTSTA